jgi:hypothetical protein
MTISKCLFKSESMILDSDKMLVYKSLRGFEDGNVQQKLTRGSMF